MCPRCRSSLKGKPPLRRSVRSRSTVRLTHTQDTSTRSRYRSRKTQPRWCRCRPDRCCCTRRSRCRRRPCRPSAPVFGSNRCRLGTRRCSRRRHSTLGRSCTCSSPEDWHNRARIHIRCRACKPRLPETRTRRMSSCQCLGSVHTRRRYTGRWRCTRRRAAPAGMWRQHHCMRSARSGTHTRRRSTALRLVPCSCRSSRCTTARRRMRPAACFPHRGSRGSRNSPRRRSPNNTGRLSSNPGAREGTVCCKRARRRRCPDRTRNRSRGQSRCTRRSPECRRTFRSGTSPDPNRSPYRARMDRPAWTFGSRRTDRDPPKNNRCWFGVSNAASPSGKAARRERLLEPWSLRNRYRRGGRTDRALRTWCRTNRTLPTTGRSSRSRAPRTTNPRVRWAPRCNSRGERRRPRAGRSPPASTASTGSHGPSTRAVYAPVRAGAQCRRSCPFDKVTSS